MRILVLGGDGMLGHELVRSWSGRHQVFTTFRQDAAAYAGLGEAPERQLFGVDVRNLQDVLSAVAQVRPQAVVNAVGIVKQRATAKESIPSLEVNALFPHRLAVLCLAAGARLVHLSTDCVFSGRRATTPKATCPTPTDLYGRSKLLGEVRGQHCITLRTSMIGLELTRKASLIEWFLAQQGRIKGFRRAIFSGLTTTSWRASSSMRFVAAPDAPGLWHVSSDPISKYDLLRGLAERLGRPGIEIRPDDEFPCDRSLDSSALRAAWSYRRRPGTRWWTSWHADSRKGRTLVILEGKRILVTGGTGSLGRRSCAGSSPASWARPARSIVFSRDEAKQHEMRLDYLHRTRDHRRGHLPELHARSGVPHRRRARLRRRLLGDAGRRHRRSTPRR